MAISAQEVKQLRDQTGAGMMECKKALTESNGDMAAALDYLRKRGVERSAKLSTREMSQGWIGSYVHNNGRVGVIVELNCETDFVAKNDKFQELLKDLSMHIAAMAPVALEHSELDPAFIEAEKAVMRGSDELKGKPAEMIEKIIDGKIKKVCSKVCLMDQPFVKDDKKSIRDLMAESVANMGENITIKRFSRFEIGS